MIQQLLRLHLRQLWLDPPLPARVIILLAVILAYGSAGFLYFELPANPDLGWGDGLWYTVVTMATVGYGDLFPKTAGGRFLVGFPLMFFGVGLLGYILSILATTLISARRQELSGMNDFHLSDHLVVINYPGLIKLLRVISELRHANALGEKTATVLIDEDLPELPAELAALGVRYVRGNPARDETLQRASIDSARHAVVLAKRPGDATGDSLNIAIALAIEGRARQVNTVVECVDPAAEELLRKAGCDHVVCSDRFDAFFVSQELLNPGIQDVLAEIMSCTVGQQLFISPWAATQASRWTDVAQRCSQSGHILVGLRRGGKSLLNPHAEERVQPGDALVTLGPSPLRW